MSAKPKTVAKKQAAKTSAPAFKKGDKVSFTGWSGDAPEDVEIEEGTVGTVKAVSKTEVEVEIEDTNGDTLVVPFAA